MNTSQGSTKGRLDHTSLGVRTRSYLWRFYTFLVTGLGYKQKGKQKMILELETPTELEYCDCLNMLVEDAFSGSVHAKNILKRLWPENNWDTIRERLNTEGSTWYVWYMNGVHRLMGLDRE